MPYFDIFGNIERSLPAGIGSKFTIQKPIQYRTITSMYNTGADRMYNRNYNSVASSLRQVINKTNSVIITSKTGRNLNIEQYLPNDENKDFLKRFFSGLAKVEDDHQCWFRIRNRWDKSNAVLVCSFDKILGVNGIKTKVPGLFAYTSGTGVYGYNGKHIRESSLFKQVMSSLPQGEKAIQKEQLTHLRAGVYKLRTKNPQVEHAYFEKLNQLLGIDMVYSNPEKKIITCTNIKWMGVTQAPNLANISIYRLSNYIELLISKFQTGFRLANKMSKTRAEDMDSWVLTLTLTCVQNGATAIEIANNYTPNMKLRYNEKENGGPYLKERYDAFKQYLYNPNILEGLL